MLAFVIPNNVKINQMDIDTAFLILDIEEDIFIDISDVYGQILQYIIDPEKDIFSSKAANMFKERKAGNKVCAMQTSLYGLWQP